MLQQLLRHQASHPLDAHRQVQTHQQALGQHLHHIEANEHQMKFDRLRK
jgi:hypothetical protein